jgi:hypothetical protein
MTQNRGIFVKRNGSWVEVDNPSARQGGQWNDVQKGYVNVNGTWKQFYPSSGTVSFTNPGSYSWKVPPGIHSITIDATGAGGGGGGSSEVGSGGGGGGGGSGGYVSQQSMAVIPGETLTITVGSGGAGAPFVGRTLGAPGGNAGSDTVITGSQGSIICTGGQGGGGGTGNGGGGGGGGSIICTKLFELGYLSESVYEADERFGAYLRATDPTTYYGYLKWAGTVVAWIEGNGPNIMPWIKNDVVRKQRQTELVTRWTVRIATPWAKHMAYTMGAVAEDSRAGRIIMKTGSAISRIVGHFSKTTQPATNGAVGYLLWATFGIFWLLAGIK